MGSSHESLIREILIARGYDTADKRQAFLDPRYDSIVQDAFLLPDMQAAVDRIVMAHKNQEQVYIYGDYDIDGLTATTLLLDAFSSFGIKTKSFIPNRFIDGYGLSKRAMDELAEKGAKLVVTVDCGSLSHKEIEHANNLGMEVIVTDHHTVADVMPAAVATINPKRPDHEYPFIDFAGVGVAFKLVKALQTKLSGLKKGQEKWLLDLVALGTVCDVVSLTSENRVFVKWGIEVLRKTRRPGLRALIAVARIKPSQMDARSLGFGLGPRLNASGRLETAQLSLDLLTTNDSAEALGIAERLEVMNLERRATQDKIFLHAQEKYQERVNDPVLIVSDPSWSHGIIGIVAAKLLEKYQKPTFVLQELPDGTAKGSARSFGDFSAVAAIRATEQHLIKGGGHSLAAGVTIKNELIDKWRDAMTIYYQSLGLGDQLRYLLPNADVTLEGFGDFHEGLITEIATLEPFGNGNPSPIFRISPVEVIGRRVMGDRSQHVKYTLADKFNKTFQVIAFNKADDFSAVIGDLVSVWVELTVNEWQGRRTVEGRLLRMDEV